MAPDLRLCRIGGRFRWLEMGQIPQGFRRRFGPRAVRATRGDSRAPFTRFSRELGGQAHLRWKDAAFVSCQLATGSCRNILQPMSIVRCAKCGADFPGPTLHNVTVRGFGDNSRAIAATCPHCHDVTGVLPPGDGTFSTSPTTGRIERVAHVLAKSDLGALRQLSDSLTVARATNDVGAAAAVLQAAGLLESGDSQQTMSLREQRIWQLVVVILGVLAVIVPMRSGSHQPTEDQIRRICHQVSEQSKVAGSRKVGRNDRCPCGSGAKFKKCHGAPPTK